MDKEINPFDRFDKLTASKLSGDGEQSRTIKWSSPEYHYYEKDIGWYWLAIIASIILVAIALAQKNFLFAVFIIIAAVLTINWGRRAPETLDFILSDQGLDIGGKKIYPFEDLEAFAIIPIEENAEISELVIKTRGRLNSWVKIIIATERSEPIKKLLAKFLPEVELSSIKRIVYREYLIRKICKNITYTHIVSTLY